MVLQSFLKKVGIGVKIPLGTILFFLRDRWLKGNHEMEMDNKEIGDVTMMLRNAQLCMGFPTHPTKNFPMHNTTFNESVARKVAETKNVYIRSL